MSYILIKSNPVILKGHGVGGWHVVPGQELRNKLLSAPPPEATGIGPNGMDAPIYAHGGTADPHPSGHAGVGNLIQGKFKQGEYGEWAYHAGTDNEGRERNHYHGLDGIIKDLGDALKKEGLLGKHSSSLGIKLNPLDIINLAIKQTNEARKNAGRSESDMIPDVMSPEWRKTHVTSFKGKDALNQYVRDNEGRFFTAFTNSNPDTLGSFIESYSNPIHAALRNILLDKLGGEFGPEYVNAMFGEKGYIHKKWATVDANAVTLSPHTQRFSGLGGQQIKEGKLPDKFMQSMPEGYHSEKMSQNVRGYEITHHFPDAFHLHRKKGGAATASQNKAKNLFLNSIRHYLAQGGDPNITIPVPIGTGEYVEKTLKEIEHMPTGYLDDMLKDLAKTDAFGFLFAQQKPGSKGHNNLMHIVNDYESKLEGKMGHGDMQGYTTSGGGSISPKFAASGGGGKSGQAQRAAEIFALAKVSGHSDEQGVSNLRHWQPEDAAMYDSIMGYNTTSLETVDHRRKATETIADIIAHAHSDNEGGNMVVKRPIPEDIPTSPMVTRDILHGGLYENKPSLPPHISYSSDFESQAPPLPTQSQMQKVPPGPPPEKTLPMKKPMPTPQPGGVKVVPRVTPMPAPPPAPSVPPQVEFPLQQSPELRAARRHLGQASPESFRNIAREANLPVRLQPEGPLSFGEQRYQQAMGDPGQTFLSQYMKSQDKDLSITDRITKAMEDMQMDDALADDTVMKHALARPINIADEFGIRHLAKSVDLTPVDVKTIAHSVGDWERIAKRLNVSSKVVKVIKVSIGGI